jgi:hypothetical protein
VRALTRFVTQISSTRLRRWPRHWLCRGSSSTAGRPTLPLNAATLGLFSLVVTALMFFLTALLSPAYHIDGLIPGVVGTVIVAVLSALINHFVRD